jgi:hypothetical protein
VRAPRAARALLLVAACIGVWGPRAVAQSSPPAPDTLTYATSALRDVVARAVARNTRVPAGLGGYTARVESEISIGGLRREGQEFAFTLEQAASDVTWDRSGAFAQHVVGYRAQQVGLSVATLPLFEDSWVVPSLYGNRLALLFGADSSRGGRRRDRDGERVLAVHPLAEDRERYYRFAGGDTVLTITLEDRAIPIVRVLVTPREDLRELAVLFSGEVDLDATRSHIVRMRGSFSRVGEARRGVLDAGLRGVANVELINREIDGQYWLPAEQRFELHATAVPLADNRAVFRILTRFGPVTVTPPTRALTEADTLQSQRHALSLASRDSLGRFRAWLQEIGAQNAAVSARDFDDVAPDLFRSDGKPIVLWQAEKLGDFIRATRVEGPFTGLGVTVKMRDAAPGLLLRGTAGYAWVERTVRGRAIVEWQRGDWMLGTRIGRGLDITNDFRTPIDSGPNIGGFTGTLDPYDYVDRRSATVQLVRKTGDGFGSEWRVDAGVVDDRGMRARWVTPVWPGYEPRINRGVDAGQYARTVLTYDWRPDVSGEFLRPGVGGRVLYERGDGQLQYQRLEARVAARENWGRWTLALRADGGLLVSDAPPPQQLFEMGSLQGLPGYEYKEFAGTRAVLARGSLMYRLPILEAPIVALPRWWLPGLGPALTVAVQAGRAEVHSDAARTSVQRLGAQCAETFPPMCTPVARPSDGWRGSAGVGMRFFGGAVTLLMARPFDGAGWRFVYAFGGQL